MILLLSFYLQMLFKPVRMAYTKKRRKKEGRNMAYITFEQIKNDSTVATYIRQADIALKAYGYTEHSFPHVTRRKNCGENSGGFRLPAAGSGAGANRRISA